MPTYVGYNYPAPAYPAYYGGYPAYYGGWPTNYAWGGYNNGYWPALGYGYRY